MGFKLEILSRRRSCFVVAFYVLTCHPKVRQLRVPLLINKQILLLNIPMQNIMILMQILQPNHAACNEPARDIDGELLLGEGVLDKESIAAFHHGLDEVEVRVILKSALELHQEIGRLALVLWGGWGYGLEMGCKWLVSFRYP